MSTFLDDFMDKMYTVPNSINRFLRLIRFLDKRVENLQKNLIKDQKQFIIKMNQLKDKDKKMIATVMQSLSKDLKSGQASTKLLTNPQVTSLPLPLQQIISEYQNIISIQREIVGYSKEKTQVGSQLTYQILQHHQFLQKQMRSKYLKQFKQEQIEQNRLSQMPLTQLSALIKKKKQKQLMQNYPTKKKEEFLYDPKQDKFCYCGQPSYGDMVQCENIYCQRQWFHINCIQQKIQSDKSWFCLDCQKSREKTRNPISRSFFSSN